MYGVSRVGLSRLHHYMLRLRVAVNLRLTDDTCVSACAIRCSRAAYG